jgi:hypothetical protein
MRRFSLPILLVALVIVAACARSSDNLDKMQPGTRLTLTLADGSVVEGRLVEVKPQEVIVAPNDGGEWKTISRSQISSATAEPGQQAAAEEEAAPAGSGPSATPATTPSARPRGASAASTRPAGTPGAPAAPRVREITIPADTVIDARLDTELGSNTSKVESPVQATLTEPIVIDNVEVVPAGSVLHGVVTAAEPSGRVKGVAELGFTFSSLAVAGGREYQIQTEAVTQQANKTTAKDALKIGAPAVGGAIVGGILGGKKGAAIGGAVGGGAGTAAVLTTRGEEVHLTPGTALKVKLVQALPVAIPLGAAR